MAAVKRRGCDDDETEIQYGDIQTGSVLISDIGPELTKPRKLKARLFPFGFQASVAPAARAHGRHRDTVRP